MSRSGERNTFDQAVRIAWAEGDLDEIEADMAKLEKALDVRLDKFQSELESVKKTAIGILVALATTGVLLAVNVWLVMAK